MEYLLSKVKKTHFILIFLIIILTTIVSFTLAYLNLKSIKANVFEIGKVDVEVHENFDELNGIKKDVYFKNMGNVYSYIRAEILYYFIDKENNILFEEPIENVDYSIDLSSDDWFLGNDGFYYYKKKVLPNENTKNLINECIKLKTYEDKTLVVEVVAQAIQANPNTAAIETWKVEIENGEIVSR